MILLLLAMACLSWIQVLIVGVPVILLTQNLPTASYFTRAAVVFLVCVPMLLLLFVPKMRLMAARPEESPSQVYQPSGVATLDHRSWKTTSTRTTTSNEDILRLRQRIRELEDLLGESTHREVLLGESTHKEKDPGPTSKMTAKLEPYEEEQKEPEEEEAKVTTNESQV